ncbi:MAG: hypothetical protein AAB875_04595, partial [Patescibacteria group bacterium]
IMQSIKEVLSSPWRGSERTAEKVREQVREKYGDEVAEDIDPATDAMPFSNWLSQGYVPRKNSKALKSITILEIKDPKSGEVVKRIKRVVNLFHKNQVTKVT